MANSVVVDYQAKTAQFTTDTARAAKHFQAQTKQMHASAVAMGVVIGEAIAGVAEGVARMVEASVASTVELAHLAEKTGLSAAALGGLRLAAAQSGVDMDRLGKVVSKVAGIQLESAAGSRVAKAEMAFFGITAKDTADNALDKLIKGFASLPPSFDRAGLAVKIFGQRLGTDFLLVADKAKGGLSGVEAKAASLGVALDDKTLEAAEKFEASMGIIRLQAQSVAEVIATGTIPIIDDFIKTLSDPAIISGFKAIAEGAITAFTTVISYASQAAGEVAKLAQDIAASSAGAAKGDIVREEDEVDRLTARIAKINSWSKSGLGNALVVMTQGTRFTAPGGGLLTPQQELDAERARLGIVQTNLKGDLATVAAAAGGITPKSTAARDAAANASTVAENASAAAVADANKRYAALVKALTAAAGGHQAHAKAAKDDTNAINAFNLQFDVLTDSMQGPAGHVMADQAKELERLKVLYLAGGASAAKYAEAQALVAEKTKIMLAAIKADDLGPVTKNANDYAVALGYLKNDEETMKFTATEAAQAEGLLAKQFELSAKAARDQLNPFGKLIEDMQTERKLLGLTVAARELDNFQREHMIQLSGSQVKAYLAEADALQKLQQSITLQDSVRQNFAGDFTDIITGAKSAKQAIKAFADSVFNDFARLVSQNFSAKLFGEQGQNGGGMLGGWLSKLTGGFTGAGDSGHAAALAANTAALYANTAALGGGDAGLLSGIFSGGSGSSSDTSAGIIGAIANLIPGFASGTMSAPGGMAIVGEHGPELVNLPRGSQVIPNHMLASNDGGGVTQNYYVNGSIDRRTATQMRQEAAMKQQRAVARNR